jgi:hypothetical protein
MFDHKMNLLLAAEFDALAPHVSRVSLLSLHLFDVLLRLVVTHVTFRFDDIEQNISHICCHALRVTGKPQKTENVLLDMPELRSFCLTRRGTNVLCSLR